MARTKRRAEDERSDEDWGEPVAGTPVIAGGDEPATVTSRRAKDQPGRGRTSVILLVSLLVQLIVVGAAGNPGSVGNATRYANRHSDLLGHFVGLPHVYSWRIKQPTIDPGNLLASEWFGLLALVAVSTLLAGAVVRGPITFWRAGVGVWMSVLIGTLANGMVRRAVVNDLGRYDDNGGKAYGVLFTGGRDEIVAGIITGLLAALAAAIAAVLTRRPAEVVLPADAVAAAPYVEPAAPPPWHGDEARTEPDYTRESSYQDPSASSYGKSYGTPYEASYGSSYGDSAAATTSLPRQDAPRDDWQDAEVTRQFSAAGSAGGSAASTADAAPETERQPTTEPEPASAPADSRTQALPVSDFPRPPDDEELGHQPADDEGRDARS